MSYIDRSGYIPSTQTVAGGHVVPGQRSRGGRVTPQPAGNVRVVEVRPNSQIPLSQQNVLGNRVVVVQTPARRVPPVVREALPPPSPQRSNRASSDGVAVVVKTQQNVRR